MIFTETGKICDQFYVVGIPSVPVYLLDGPEPVIFDAGFTGLSRIYKSGIQEILGDRKPSYLFLTHSHFDHLGAVGHFKSVWPELLIGASSRCIDILKKQGAVELIKSLNIEALKDLKQSGITPIHEDAFEVFNIDIRVEHDDEFKAGPDLTVRAINTPGHTWDFISYWIPERKILICSEATACYHGEYIQPEFLADFDAYLESLGRLEELDPDVLCSGHRTVFTGSDALEHIHTSFKAAKDFFKIVEGFLIAEKGDIDKTVARVKEIHWDQWAWPKQPEPAYLLNTRKRVENIWGRMKD